MRTIHRTVVHGAPGFAAALFSIAALAGPAGATAAVRVYEAVVPLGGASTEDRAAGLAEALRAVAVKASGRREAADNPAVASANPAKYVQRYATTADKMLKVGFESRAIEQLLQQAGLPFWPAERPVTTISAPVPDHAPVEAAAQRRGLPIEWASAPGAPAATAGRAVLVGTPVGGEFAWTFTHEGRTVQGRGTAEDGVHLAADTLASRYAPPSTRSVSELDLRIGGVDDVAHYAGLLEYLRGLSLVRSVDVRSLEGSTLTVHLAVRGDLELLGRIAALEGRLQPAPRSMEGTQQPVVDFLYQP